MFPGIGLARSTFCYLQHRAGVNQNGRKRTKVNSEEKKLILEKARELRAQGMLKKDIFKIFGLGEHFFRSLK